MGVFTVADMCVECKRLPKDDFRYYLEDADEAGAKLCRHWAGIFQARDGDLQDRAFETTLDFVHRAPEDLQWTLNKEDFDAMLAAKGSALATDGLLYSGHRSARSTGSQLLAAHEKHLVGEHFSTELHRRVFIPKSDAADTWGRIVRSPDALRLLTLWYCDCNVLTTALCFAFRQYPISRIHPR